MEKIKFQLVFISDLEEIEVSNPLTDETFAIICDFFFTEEYIKIDDCLEYDYTDFKIHCRNILSRDIYMHDTDDLDIKIERVLDQRLNMLRSRVSAIPNLTTTTASLFEEYIKRQQGLIDDKQYSSTKFNSIVDQISKDKKVKSDKYSIRLFLKKYRHIKLEQFKSMIEALDFVDDVDEPRPSVIKGKDKDMAVFIYALLISENTNKQTLCQLSERANPSKSEIFNFLNTNYRLNVKLKTISNSISPSSIKDEDVFKDIVTVIEKVLGYPLN